MPDQKQAHVHAAGAGGAWAVVLTYGTHRRELQGTEPGAPADRMALTAVVAGLECLTRPTAVEVRVHSDYVRGGGQGGLWDRLRAAAGRHDVSWAWSGDFEELTKAQDLAGPPEPVAAAPVAAERVTSQPVTSQPAAGPPEAAGSIEDFIEALGEHVANDPDGPDPAELVELADEMVEDEERAITAVGKGAITFTGIGAVAVPPAIAAQARVGWRVVLSAAHVEGNWYLLDVAV
ncbi:hypothetical protein [Dactylosporangium matsuzakiense]|uniref:Uncharacterized protein n=1 Tax=Dactylosporangium matsuzakiense TaxID=53360 RepID=A0A9W6KQ82_9ACTN|nr:hypothetical protein [Dactylosporangium matsuzakiense]UWZ48048.1 hypothetical protein Dmats_17600 [Dactylosporangium matsuzakiense]GLL03534.1 hypothetical protein GCM10017581_052800 [Dactylosporangium matsuzakiense]